MSRIRQAVVALAAVTLAAAPAAAQQGQRGGPEQEARRGWAAPGVMARNPVNVLLEQREALELTAEQVTRLEAIEARVDRENAPRIARLQAALDDRSFRELSDEERAQLRARMQALEPVREEIRATNRAAMLEARDVLTADQQDRLRGIMRRDHARGMRGQRPGGSGHSGRTGRPGAGRGPGVADRPFAGPVPGGIAGRVLDRREALGLTAEQVTRLEAIRASHRELLEAVREILTDEQEARLRALAPRRGDGPGRRPAGVRFAP